MNKFIFKSYDENSLADKDSSMETENLTSLWLRHDILRALRVAAAQTDVSFRALIEEYVIVWIEGRQKSASTNIFGYPYLSPPKKHLTPEGEPFGKIVNFHLTQNTAAHLRDYAKKEHISLATILYTAIYQGFGKFHQDM